MPFTQTIIDEALHGAAENGHAETVSVLLERGANINAKNKDGQTALHGAAKNGHAETVSVLLDRGADIEAEDKDGKTPLYLAKINNHEGLAIALVKAGLILTLNKSLLIAAGEGNYEEVENILKQGADINAKNKGGFTALHEAAKNGHATTVSLLLNRGADINAKNRDGETPPYLAKNNKHEDLARALTKAGLILTLNKKLLIAAGEGNYKEVEDILKRLVSFEAKNENDLIDLTDVIANSHTKAVKLLLDKNNNGLTALTDAAENGHAGIVSILLKGGNNFEATNNDQTPLHNAASSGYAKTVKLLLDNGLDIDAQDHTGATALILAAKLDHEEVVEILLCRNAKIDVQDDLGYTALHFAAENGHNKTVSILLNRGADIGAKNTEGNTALSLVEKAHKKCREGYSFTDEHVFSDAIESLSSAKKVAAIKFERSTLDKLFVNTLNLLNKSLTSTQQESQADSNDNVPSNEKGQFSISELKEPPEVIKEEPQKFLTIENGRFVSKESPKATVVLTDKEARFFINPKNQNIIEKSLDKLLSIDDVKFDPVDGVSSVKHKTENPYISEINSDSESDAVLVFKAQFENLFEKIKEELKVEFRLETDIPLEKESESLKNKATNSEKGSEDTKTSPPSSTTPQSAIAAKASENSKSNQKS